jgi:hypothetical protein
MSRPNCSRQRMHATDDRPDRGAEGPLAQRREHSPTCRDELSVTFAGSAWNTNAPGTAAASDT